MAGKIALPRALGVHIFAGGFTCGVVRAGFKVVAHLESGNYGTDSARLNWPMLDIRVGESNWSTKDFSGVDFIYANPPCAIFSNAGIDKLSGAKNNWRTDPRTNCWNTAFEVFADVQPKVLAIESVCQAYQTGREMIDQFTKLALAMNYSVVHLMMNSEYVGLPQTRKRFFFICHRPSNQPEFRFDFKDNELTVGSVLNEVDDPGDYKSNFPNFIRGTPQGGKLRDTFDNRHPGKNGIGSGRPGFVHQRLRSDSKMGAFIGNCYAHPTKDRYIGLSEIKALCGYPADFQLETMSAEGRAKLLARAVLPPVGHWLASAIKKAIVLPKRSIIKPTVTRIDLRKPPGSYEDISSEYRTKWWSNRRNEFNQLVCRVKSCDLCPAMRGRTRVLSQLNGSVNAKIMFIGEAPGKYGADLSGTPFYGDASGINFERLLGSIGLTMDDVFVTNAALCNPRDEKDNNRAPSSVELQNCSRHLRDTITLVNPGIIVTLGNNALQAIKLLEPHEMILSRDVGRKFAWNNRWLIPVYHPSPRVIASHRNMEQQRKDFSRIKELLHAV